MSPGDKPRTEPWLRLVIISDVEILLQRLRAILSSDPEVSCVETVDDPESAVRQTRLASPRAVLLESGFPQAISLLRDFRGFRSRPYVIAFALDECETAVMPWVEAGVAGYIPRSASASELLSGVKRIVRGEQVCAPEISGALMRRISLLSRRNRTHRAIGQSTALTPREWQIARLLGEGLSNKLIARHLGIEVATTKCHVHNILKKLRLHRRLEIAAWLHRQDLSLHGHDRR